MSKVPFVVSQAGTAGEISGRVNAAGRVRCPGGTWTGTCRVGSPAFAVTPRVPAGAAPCASHGRFLGTGHGGHRHACTFLSNRRGESHGACTFPVMGAVGCVVRGEARRGVWGEHGGGAALAHHPRQHGNRAGTGPYSARTCGHGACTATVRSLWTDSAYQAR